MMRQDFSLMVNSLKEMASLSFCSSTTWTKVWVSFALHYRQNRSFSGQQGFPTSLWILNVERLLFMTDQSLLLDVDIHRYIG